MTHPGVPVKSRVGAHGVASGYKPFVTCEFDHGTGRDGVLVKFVVGGVMWSDVVSMSFAPHPRGESGGFDRIDYGIFSFVNQQSCIRKTVLWALTSHWKI